MMSIGYNQYGEKIALKNGKQIARCVHGTWVFTIFTKVVNGYYYFYIDTIINM